MDMTSALYVMISDDFIRGEVQGRELGDSV
jgi:hypothetical protein